MKPNVQKKLIFDNKCGCICDLELIERAMLWYAGDVLKQKRVIYMHGRYPAVSIYDKKVHIHRLIMAWRINRYLETKECVHHIDGNPLNNQFDNLELTTQAEHIRTHRKGVKQDPEFARRRTQASNMARFGYRNKPIHTKEQE